VNNVTLAHVSKAVDRALQSGNEQIGYPWTEEDCSPAERLLLAALAQQGSDSAPVSSNVIRGRLDDAGLSVPVGEATNRLQLRGVLRAGDAERITFVVPLFRSWLLRKNYGTVQSAMQYNQEHSTPGVQGAADV
jgi:hypothetical protein